MNSQNVALLVAVAALVAVVVFKITPKAPGATVSDNPVDTNSRGPSYLTYNLPYGYYPSMIMPTRATGMQGDPMPTIYPGYGGCGCGNA